MCFHFPRLSFFSNAFSFFSFGPRVLFPGRKSLVHINQILFSLHMRTPKASEARVTRPPGDRGPAGRSSPWEPSPTSCGLHQPFHFSSAPKSSLSINDLQTLTSSRQRNSFVLMSLRTPSTPSTSSTCLRGQGLPSGSRKGKPGSPWAL